MLRPVLIAAGMIDLPIDSICYNCTSEEVDEAIAEYESRSQLRADPGIMLANILVIFFLSHLLMFVVRNKVVDNPPELNQKQEDGIELNSAPGGIQGNHYNNNNVNNNHYNYNAPAAGVPVGYGVQQNNAQPVPGIIPAGMNRGAGANSRAPNNNAA